MPAVTYIYELCATLSISYFNMIKTSSFIRIVLISSISLLSCRKTYMNITNEYIEVSKPGQQFGLIEIEALKMDSLFQYPSEEKIVRAMTLIKRRTGKQIGGDDYAKIIFGKKNKRFYWRVYKDPGNEYFDSDTVLLKPKTWYRLSKWTGVYNTYYFYWTGNKGDFIKKVKPNPGAW